MAFNPSCKTQADNVLRFKESVSPVPVRKCLKKNQGKIIIKNDSCLLFGSKNNAFQASIIFLSVIPGGSFPHMVDYLLTLV